MVPRFYVGYNSAVGRGRRAATVWLYFLNWYERHMDTRTVRHICEKTSRQKFVKSKTLACGRNFTFFLRLQELKLLNPILYIRCALNFRRVHLLLWLRSVAIRFSVLWAVLIEVIHIFSPRPQYAFRLTACNSNKTHCAEKIVFRREKNGNDSGGARLRKCNRYVPPHSSPLGGLHDGVTYLLLIPQVSAYVPTLDLWYWNRWRHINLDSPAFRVLCFRTFRVLFCLQYVLSVKVIILSYLIS